jgi:hypothetical protein
MNDNNHPPIDFTLLWERARKAAFAAGEAEIARLGPTDKYGDSLGVPTGSAWLSISKSQPFGIWADEHGIANTGDEEEESTKDEFEIWDAEFSPSNSVPVHLASIAASFDVLVRELPRDVARSLRINIMID